MKRVFAVALIAVLAVAVLGTAVFAEYNNGEYVGVVKGDRATTVVVVGIANGAITNVEILNQTKASEAQYSYEPGRVAFAQFPGSVIAAQSAEVDAVAGATGSHEDYTAATQMALDMASGTYSGNTYYGLSRDYGHGHVVVEVVLNDAKDEIVEVNFITSPSDGKAEREALMTPKVKGQYPYEPGIEAYTTFEEKVISAQNVSVDGVAGATHSNHAYEAALKSALSAAGVLGDFE